jgi:hypothetical protein
VPRIITNNIKDKTYWQNGECRKRISAEATLHFVQILCVGFAGATIHQRDVNMAFLQANTYHRANIPSITGSSTEHILAVSLMYRLSAI